jgi:hypothetical protein
MDGAYEVADGADALVIVTEWDAFRALNLKRIAELLKSPVLVDLRNIYPPQDVIAAGLSYTGIGKGSSIPRIAVHSTTCMNGSAPNAEASREPIAA